MNNKHTNWIPVPRRAISWGEKMMQKRLVRLERIKQAKQLKRNQKIDKELLLSSEDNL